MATKYEKTIYNKIPFVESRLLARGKCPISSKGLQINRIQFRLYNRANRPVEVGSVRMNYCTRCNIGFATEKIVETIKDCYENFQVHIITLKNQENTKKTAAIFLKEINELPPINSRLNTKQYELQELEKRLKRAHRLEKAPLHVGISEHRCRGYMCEIRMIDVAMHDVYGKERLVTMMQCPQCKKVFIREKFYKNNKHLFKDYKLILNERDKEKNQGIDAYNVRQVAEHHFALELKEDAIKDTKSTIQTTNGIKNQGVQIQTEANAHRVKIESGKIEFPKKDSPQKIGIRTEGLKRYYEIDEPIKKISEDDTNENGLSNISDIKRLGYDLTLGRDARWRVLEEVIIPKIGKGKVIKHLKFLIRINKTQPNKVSAVLEWEYDLKRLMK